MADTLKPLFNHVVLKRIDQGERKLDSGIVLPGTVKDESTYYAEVVAVGPGIVQDGFLREPPKELRPGAKVFVPSFQSFKAKFNGQEYLQVRDTDILCVVQNDETK